MQQYNPERETSVGSQYDNIHASGGYNVMGNVYHSYSLPQPDPKEAQRNHILTQLYYDSMNSRKDAIYAANESTCEWIWDTTFAEWARDHDATSNIFWIAGKPGSGKSTLMKYLSNSSVLQDLNWTVVYFFFDFRLKDQTGNSIDGLLRSILMQLTQEMKDIPADISSLAHSTDITSNKLIESFRRIFKINKANIFVLVDGLDEFQGNMHHLMNHLLELRQISNVKLCLASRPHAVVNFMLKSCSLQMSEQNARGIERYVNLAVEPYEGSSTAIDWQSIKATLNQRAEGVFLWVYLVLEEILQACPFETAEQLKARLDSIPDHLDELYQRLLDAIPSSQQTEAAIIYTLVDEAAISMTTEQLQSILVFLHHQGHSEVTIAKADNEQAFLNRLISMIGGILHLQRRDWPEDLHLFVESRTRPESGLEELIEYGTGVSQVQLIHRTIKSFMSDCLWAKKKLPPSFSAQYPSHILERISSEALKISDSIIGPSLKTILARVYDTFTSLSDLQLIVADELGQSIVLSWVALLHFGIIRCSRLCWSLYMDCSESGCLDSLQNIVQSRLATLHYALTWSHYTEHQHPLPKFLSEQTSDLILAAHHFLWSYVETRAPQILALKDNQRNAIVAAVLDRHGLGGTSCFNPNLDLILGGFTTEECELIDLILSFQRKLNRFHAAISIILGQPNRLSFTQRLLSNKATLPGEEIEIPSGMLGVSRLLNGRTLLSLWACKFGESFPIVEDVDRSQLRMVLSNGTSIGDEVEETANVVHYLVSTHWFDHIYTPRHLIKQRRASLCKSFFASSAIEINRVFHKLYMVEESHADFKHIVGRGSALDAFHRGRSRFFARLPGLIESNIYINRANLSYDMMATDELEFMLQHKQIHGHLPRPMLSEYELLHYRCLPRKECQICQGIDGTIQDVEEGQKVRKFHKCFKLELEGEGEGEGDPELHHTDHPSLDDTDDEESEDEVHVLSDTLNNSNRNESPEERGEATTSTEPIGPPE